MAKVTLPLLGAEASGTVANSLTFGKWKGINYVRARVTPANPQTAGQIDQRNLMTWCVRFWQSLPSVVQDGWVSAARAQKMTGFNLFLKRNLIGLKAGTNNDSWIASPGQSGAPPVLSVSATGGEGQVSVSATVGDVVPGTTINAVYFVLVKLQSTRGEFAGPVLVAEDTSPPYGATFSDLSAGDYVVAAFVKATDTKGNVLRGVPLNDTATVM